MPTHVALLRGINVGGHARIGMPALRSLAEGLGHTQAATHLQSGNLVFTPAGRSSTESLALGLQRAILRELDLDPLVIVLTAAQWREVVEANPYPREADPTKVHAAVQQEPVDAGQRAALKRILEECTGAGVIDHLTVAGRVTYLHTPGGLGRSKLAERLARVKGAGQDRATMRNWRTVLAIQSLLSPSGGGP